MSDLIKRSDAIYVLCNGCNKVSQCVNDKYSWCDKGLTIRVGVPSADRPRGEWKFVGSSIEMMWECPFCGEHTFGFEEHLPNYCSNCGADMRKGANDGKRIIMNIIDSAPSIDIVRCSECAYCNVQNTKYLYAICERHGIEFKPFEDDTRTHYCAWGERRTDE